ncbi:MAG: amino acid permease [Christensenellaceae bacterium]|jgi:APA family basic amino acid/polyamine antiporter|nr:amino acid permease [Christensenellaceae bacterium]
MEEIQLTKKYGLPTAITLVVGSVIGAGVFFKAKEIISYTGSIGLSVLAWAVGGIILLATLYAFAVLAVKYGYGKKAGGFVAYSEIMLGEKYSYGVGWFFATVYYPALTAILAYVSASYTCSLFSLTGDSTVWIITFAYLLVIYIMNLLSPKIAGKFQVSTTVIKVIPLILMAVVGLIIGLVNGTTVSNFADTSLSKGTGLLAAIAATAFAYEGGHAVVNLNFEIKNGKRAVPIALIGGGLFIIAIYVLYFIGVTSALPIGEFISSDNEIGDAFSKIFGGASSVIVMVFVVISCLGGTNAFTLETSRSMYYLSIRNKGLYPSVLKQVDVKTNMPTNSGLVGLGLSAFWVVMWYLFTTGIFNLNFSDMFILPTYMIYIPIFFMMMFKNKESNWFNRFVAPCLAILGCLFMCFAVIYSYKMDALWYMLIVAGIMALGYLIRLFNRKNNDSVAE